MTLVRCTETIVVVVLHDAEVSFLSKKACDVFLKALPSNGHNCLCRWHVATLTHPSTLLSTLFYFLLPLVHFLVKALLLLCLRLRSALSYLFKGTSLSLSSNPKAIRRTKIQEKLWEEKEEEDRGGYEIGVWLSDRSIIYRSIESHRYVSLNSST